MKGRIILLLLMFAFLCNPVYAKELEGNGNISVTGQTTVTAVIKENGESEGPEEVGTGDNSKTLTYFSLIILSTMILLNSQIQTLKNK